MAKRGDDFPVLLTQRLRLRRVESRDADALHACFGHPDAMRFWDLPPCQTMAETVRIMRWLAKTTSPYDHLGWAIADKAHDRCLGMVCYHHREARNKRLELGYITDSTRSFPLKMSAGLICRVARLAFVWARRAWQCILCRVRS